MGKVQLWQSEGLGADRETLEKVIHIYKTDGVQGMKSQQALDNYIKKLSDSRLRDMWKIDEETTIQILVDCFGAVPAFRKYTLISNYKDTNTKELNEAGWISPEAYAEVTVKYQKRVDALRDQTDDLLREISIKNYEFQEAELQIKKLQTAIQLYKADLYDYYAKKGIVPGYEQ